MSIIKNINLTLKLDFTKISINKNFPLSCLSAGLDAEPSTIPCRYRQDKNFSEISTGRRIIKKGVPEIQLYFFHFTLMFSVKGKCARMS